MRRCPGWPDSVCSLQTSHMPPELTVRELVERYAEVLPTGRAMSARPSAMLGLSGKAKARAGVPVGRAAAQA